MKNPTIKINQVECENCNGKGTWEVYYDDSEIVRGEACCDDCNGTGLVDDSWTGERSNN